MSKALDLLNKVKLNSVKANLNKPKVPTVTTPSENKYVKSVLADMKSQKKKSGYYADPITSAKYVAQKMSETAAEENSVDNAYYARTISDPENMTSDDLRTLKENLRIQLNREQRKDSSKQDADKIAQIKGYITAIDSTKLDGGTVSINEMNSTARAAYNKMVSPDTTDYGQGNINLKDRPIVLNTDGSYSTVRSMSFNDKGKEILIPTVIRDENGNGKIVSDDEAIQHYYDTGEYLGKFNSPTEADEYAEKLHKNQQKLYEKKGFAQSLYAKYGINTDKFSYTDLAKWKSDNGVSGEVKGELTKNNVLRKLLLAQIDSANKLNKNPELKKEYDVLSALAENNERKQNLDTEKNGNQFIPEPLNAGINSAAKGITFGLSDYLMDKTDKLRFNRTGLDDDKYVSVKDINQKQSEEHPIASFAGETIGSTVSTIGLSSIVKGISSTLKFGKGVAAATSKIPWFAKLAPQTQNVINTAISSAVETGVTFGASNAVQTGTNGGSAKDVAKGGAIGFASGAAGSAFSSAASSVLGKAAEKYSTNALVKKLYQNMNVEGTELSVDAAGRVDNYINALYKNYNLKDYWLPQQLVKAASAVTFATVSTGTSVGLNAATTDGYNPTAEETAKEIAKQATVALIFSLWNSTTEYSKLSKANKNLIMNSAKEMANEVYDLDEMYRSGKADTPEFEAKKNSFMKNADTMEKLFSTVDFVGNKEQQQQLVNGIRLLRDNVNSALKTETADTEFSPKSEAKTDYTNVLNNNIKLYGKAAPEQAARVINKATEVISNALTSTVKGTNTQAVQDINVKFLSNPNNIIDRSFVSDYSNLFVGLMAAGNGQAYRAIIQKTNNLPEVLTEYTINGYAEPEIKNTAGFNTVANTFNGVVQKAAEVNYSLRNKIYDNNPVLDTQMTAVKNGDFSVVESVPVENISIGENNQTASTPQEEENDVKPVASTQNNTSAMDKNLNIENIVEKNIYPEFRENSAEMFAKQYGGTRFSGFTQQLVKNFRETGSIGETEKNFFADNGAAVTEAIKNMINADNSNVENISGRTFDSVGNRRVKAFQYTYPQMKKYYSEMANVLLSDIKDTVKGERTPIFDESGAVTGYTGTDRRTSGAVARIKDATGASYDEISDALNRIIADSGQENVALAKRIELVMDDMLTEGYTAIDGTKVPANEEYIAEKTQIENKSGKAEAKQQIIDDYAQAVDDIMTVDDETARQNAENRVAVKIMDNTPNVILDNVKESKNLPIMINYTKLYLAVRADGVIKGHYHNLGQDVANKLPDMLTSPDAIIQLNNGRLNLLSQITSDSGNNVLVSVELNSTKDINGKYKDYNVVVTLFASDDNYIKNLTVKDGVSLRYEKKELSQVNPQLYKYLAIINDKSSVDNSIPQDNNIVNNKDMQETENNSDNDDLNKSTERTQSKKMSPELYDRFRQLQEEADKLSASASNPKSVYGAAELESRIKEQLANGVNTVDEITRKIGAKVNDIHVALFNMAVNGDVKQKPGNRYELISDTTASDKTTKIETDSGAAANKNTTDVNKSASNVEDDNGDNNIQKTESNAVTEEKSPENVLKSLSMGESVSVEEVKAAANAICDNEAEIKAGLSKLKNAELKSKMNIFDRGSYSKKDDMVEAIYSDMLSNTYYTISGKNSMTTFMNGTSMNEQIKGLIKTELKSLNAERLKTLSEKYSEEHKKHIAEREKIKNSLKNPQTLEDYSRKKRTIGLSEQENADFEKLYALTRKENRNASKSSVKSSKTEAADNFLKNNDNFTIEETKHSKTGENIWVVKPKERLATEEWKNINNSMKSLGGFYWKGNGGWNFKKNPIAEKVSEETSVQGSNVDKLRDIADNMQKSIDERFRERLTNTAKRASQAASAEAEGEKLQRTQNTIRNIAEGIENGNIKLLTDIDSKAQVDTLFRLLNLAQNDRINNIENITYSERLKERDKPYGNEDIKYAKLPLDTVYSGIIEEYAKAAEGKDGYKMIHSRLSKALKSAKNNYISVTPQLFADISKVVKNLDVIRADYWEDGTAQLNRLKRMGIENNAELRAYLREFVENIPGIDKEAERKRAIKKKEVELTNSKIDGFFPTPKPIVEKMLGEADIKPGEKVLEPSAGKGNIADAIRESYPNNTLDVVEWNASLNELLTEKGHNVVGIDFLQHSGKYDKIIMNPPFENGQDIDHIRHAYSLLNDGGRVVCIMSEGPFYRSDKKATDFRKWFDEVGGISERLPENSFKGSERSTGVNTRLVVVDKPSAPLRGKSNSNVKYSLNNNSGNDAEWWSGNTDSEANSNRKQKKAPIKAPHNIVKYLSDTFGIPISTGNIGNRKASGIYKMPAQTIRTKITNDLPIIAHELGHMFDDKYNLSDAEHINDVLNFAHKLDAEFLEQYSNSEQDGEAIAQFVRTYLSNPEKAKQGAPKFYKEFTEKLSDEDLNALNQAAEYINQYLSADFMDRLHSNIVTNKELKERTSAKEKMKKFYITIVDAFAPIKDAADYVEMVEGKQSGNKNAYTLAMNSKNADAVIAFILRKGMVDKDGNIVGKSLVECLSDIPATQLQLFADYLVLKHSPDWLAPEDGSAPKRVFADEELQNVENINRQISDLEKNYPHFVQAANNIYEYERNLAKYWCVDIGGMSEELFNSLWKRYPHYVPLYRAIKKNIGTKRSFANQRTPINRAHGSGEAIKNVIESIMYNTEKFVKFGMRNRVMQILADYADNVEGFGSFMEPVAPNMIAHTIGITDKIEQVKEMLSGLNDNDFTALTEALDDIFGDSVTSYTPVAVAGKQIVTVMRNGKFKYYQVHNKELFDAISNISPQQLGWFVKFSRKVLMPTNLLITQFNPRFAIWNPMRDIDTAYKQTQAYESMASFIIGYVRAFYHILSKSDEYKALLAAGGGHMSKFSGNIDQLEKALRELSHKDMIKAQRLAYAIFRHPIETLVSLNEFTETIPRLAEFEGMKKKGADTQEAINAAADVTTNFSRSGTAGEGLNGGFRFSNAQIQGVDKFRRTFMESSRELLKRVIIRYLLSALFTTALLEAWNRKSKESREAWDNLSKYTKNNYYCIYIGDGKFLKLAKAREAAIFNTLLERTVDKCFGDKYAFYQFGEYLSDTIIPSFVPTKALVGDTKGALHQMLGETAIGGFADNLANMDFKGTPIVSKSFEDIPKKQQTDERTTYIAYGLGQILNQSPLEIDHLIDSYGGILGQVNRSIGAMSGKNKKSGLISSFIADSTYSTDVFNYIYERRDKYKEKFLNEPTPESAAMYEKYAMGASMITKSNKLIKEMPEDEQKAAKQKLLDTVKEYREESKQTDKQIAQSLGSGLTKEYLITTMPEPQLSRKNKLSGKNEQSDLTFDEYNQYLKDYLSALNTERQKQLKSETYKAATTDKKVEFLKDANDRAKETAKKKYFSSKQKIR